MSETRAPYLAGESATVRLSNLNGVTDEQAERLGLRLVDSSEICVGSESDAVVGSIRFSENGPSLREVDGKLYWGDRQIG